MVQLLIFDVVRKVLCRVSTTRRQQTRYRQSHGGWFFFARIAFARVDGNLCLRHRLPTCVLSNYDVCVGAAETKAGNACDLRAGVFWPLAWVFHDLEVLGIEIDVAVRFAEVDRWRNDAMAHALDDLDKAHDARGGFGVSDIRFCGAKQCWVRCVAARAHGLAQGSSFNRIT